MGRALDRIHKAEMSYHEVLKPQLVKVLSNKIGTDRYKSEQIFLKIFLYL
jgi:hypothetical protein